MIETINDRHEHFVSEIREFSLLHEIDPSLPIPRLKSSLYDDCESSLPLASNIVDDAPLINLKEVFDPHLTSLSFVAPSFSSTLTDTGINDLTLLASPLPLTQCTGLAIGDTSKGNFSILEDASLLRSKELTLVEPHLEEASFAEFCVIL